MNSPQSEARDCVAEGSPANLSLGMQKLTPKTPYEVKNSSPDLHEIGEASVRTGNPGKGELKSNLDQTPSLSFAFFITVRLQFRRSPDPFFFLSRSVPSLAAMIVSDSDSATPSSNFRQADQSASGRNPGHTPSPRPSSSGVPGHKRRRLRKQYPSSTPVDEGSRVELDENIMALCHCQITDRGFADATDMVGPSIKVMRPTSTQTALDAPSGFFTVHLASLKKGLRFPLHPLLVEFLNVVDLLPCQLVPNSHRYIAGYLVRCKDVGVKPTLDHFIFTFKLTKGHKDWASYASLSQRATFLPPHPMPPPDATLLSITRQLCNKGVMNVKEVVTEETLAGLGFEFVQDELRHQADLLRDIPGGHQPDQLKDIPEEGLDCGPFVELQDSGEEMDSDLLLSRFTAGRKRKRETKGQGKRSSSHHEESPSQEPAVIVVEDQEDATQEPGTIAGKSPPHPVMQGGDLVGSSQGIALERPPSPPAVTYEVATGGRSTRLCIPPPPQSLGDVQLETLITLPAEDQACISAGSEDDLDNMVLLRLSQAAADEAMKAAEAKQKELQEEVARLTRELEEKENRCAALAVEKASQENRCVALEADKASLSLELEVERSDRVRHAEEAVESFKSSPDLTVVAMERMEELTAAWLKTEPGAQWMVKEGTKSFNCGLFRAQQWSSVKPPPLPPNPYEDFSEAYKALSANRLPDGRIDWDAPCPLHSLQCMAWESFQDEHLPLLEHECAYYASLERWTSESRTSSPVRPKEEVVLGEELGSSLPHPTCHSPSQKTPRRPGVARAASGSPSSSR
ncbi:unnamed protein product [Cuscuta campestris]|uniref:Transposase (putative) gypsy type domain-containing protein n=1 Tax=Cuscuta campestris TaxID=132261 RepID=A0A484LUI0_9ASTE|nr:unnamed protein product [Cuscuta campestris]